MTTTQRVDVERLSVSVERLPPIERDEQMQRDYIPIPGGWEVQTKGKGSTYRIAKTDDDDGERWPVTDRYLQDALTNMAHAIRADYAALLQQLAERDAALRTVRDEYQSMTRRWSDAESKLAERDAEIARLNTECKDRVRQALENGAAFHAAERAREESEQVVMALVEMWRNDESILPGGYFADELSAAFLAANGGRDHA